MARTKQTARRPLGMTRELTSTTRTRSEDADEADETDSTVGDIYDARLLEVTAALSEVERPGDCFTSGTTSQFAYPGIFVDSLGDVALPLLRERDAKELIAQCHLAPYGHGEATIVDTHVRNTWELNADQFELRNATWQRVLDDIVTAIRVPLGMSETTEFDAKLYKLLLYETGGMFHTHQDSEKEMGMFGTLVVMLPCRFTGGELVLHHAFMAAAKREPHVWDPAAASPYDLKYAAFYGDCEHEVKPVTSGYRLCLTYNLVTRATTQVPRFAGNHALYERLEKSLQAFFAETEDSQETKRQRLSLYASSSTRPARVPRNSDALRQRDCQLVYVYVLEHKYTNPGLSFAYLKNKDHLVAQSLAKFCDAHAGAFSLYLCKVKYTYEYDPDDFDPDLVERSVQLQSPWVKYGESARSVLCEQMTASLGGEIAPAGFFEDVPFEGYENHGFTGNAGSRAEKWYTSAALVVQPLRIELEQTARAGMDYAVHKWIALVEHESSYAESFAATLFAEQRQWSTADECFVPCLKTVRRLNKWEIFGDVLHSLSEIAFHEALAHTVDHFGWDTCRDLLFEVAEAARFRNRVNLVCSVLHGCDDPVRIEQLLSKVNLQPTLSAAASGTRYRFASYQNTTPTNPSSEEYARVLALAYRVSSDKLREYVVTSETNVLIKLVAPALVAFVSSSPLDAETKPAPLVEIVRSVMVELHTRMPQASSWDLSHIRLHGGRTCCQYCTELQMFLSSRTQQTLRRLMSKASRHHVHKVIEAYCGNRLSHETDRPSTLVMTKLMPAVDMHDVARETMRSLRAWTGDADETHAGGSTATAGANEIIAIDSD